MRRRPEGAMRLLLAVLLAASMLVVTSAPALAIDASVSFASGGSGSDEIGTAQVDVELNTGGLVLLGSVTVEITTAGSATPGTDYTVPTPAQVVFPAGSGDGTIVQFPVTIVDDDVDEGASETVVLGFGDITALSDGISTAPPTKHTITITDDDTRGTTNSPSSLSLTEGDPGKVYSVSLDSRPTAAVTITPSSTDGQVTIAPPSVTIQPENWETSADFTVTAVDDAKIESPHPDDTITHTISGGDYDGVTVDDVLISITDNDDFSVSIAPGSAIETDGVSNVPFVVSVSPQSPNPVVVDYTASVGGANAASTAEFDDGPGQVTIPANTASATIFLTTTGDDVDEGPNDLDGGETFLVALDSVDIGVIGTGQATGTIIDDDDAPVANPDAYGVVKGLSISPNAADGVIRNGFGTDSDADDALTSLIATLVEGPDHAAGFTFDPDGSFTYEHDGGPEEIDSFSYLVTDPGGNESNAATVTITIDPNSSPVVFAGDDQTGDEGSEIVVHATFTDEDGDVHVAQINWGDGTTSGGIVDEGARTVTGSHTYVDDGVYTVRITLNDGFNIDFDELTVTVANVAPVHVVEGPTSTTAEGSEITFTTTPIDPGAEVFTYTWDVVRNGIVFDTWVDPANGPSSTYSFTPDDDAVNGDPIKWRVRVRVDDGDGASPRRGRTVTVTNVDPAVELLADGEPVSVVAELGDEGSTVTFSLDVDDPSVDTFTYSWEVLRLGQVVATGSGPTLEFTPQDNGTFIVAIDVDDDDNQADPSSGTGAVFATFDNVAPEFAELRGNLSPRVGGNASLVAFVSDPGGDDSHTMIVDWGDGTPQTEAGTTSPIKIKHQYSARRVFAVEVCVTDNDDPDGDTDTTCEDLLINVGGRLSLGSDFNGDGRDDAAIGVPAESAGGGVHVFYSNAGGPSRADNELLIQGQAGMPDSDEAGDEFGYSVAFGDIDDDGFDDLVVGHPGEAVGGRQRAGAVTIVPGSASGLDRSGALLLHENVAGVPGSAQPFDRFGLSVAVGDFNGDAFADVAVGSPGENVADKNAAGKVTIFYGTPQGITTDDAHAIDLSSPGVAGVAARGDRFGASLAAGDFGGDGESDLAVGAPNKRITGKKRAGAVVTLRGSALGLVERRSQFWSQRRKALADRPETGDRFGLELATADFDGDGRDDLAIAAPNESVAGVARAGAVWVLRGSRPLLTGVDAARFTEDTLGIRGQLGEKDRFGSALAAADVDQDGFAELAIGIPFEDLGAKRNAGVVVLLDGTSAGLSGVGSERWHENVSGIGGRARNGDRFGTALVAINATADNRWDLLVGMPFQNTGGEKDSGAALFLRGGFSGLTNLGDRVLHQNASGVIDDAEEGDWFGFGL